MPCSSHRNATRYDARLLDGLSATWARSSSEKLHAESPRLLSIVTPKSAFFGPLGMRETHFRPDSSAGGASLQPRSIPGVNVIAGRGGIDENAFALGGVSGHAGCSAPLMTWPARPRLPEGARSTATASASKRTIEQSPSCRMPGCRLAHWVGDGEWQQFRGRLSRPGIRHTGFTGTSVWIDPGNDVFVILLSNRVNPTRENRRIGGVRTALADSVMSLMGRVNVVSPNQR